MFFVFSLFPFSSSLRKDAVLVSHRSTPFRRFVWFSVFGSFRLNVSLFDLSSHKPVAQEKQGLVQVGQSGLLSFQRHPEQNRKKKETGSFKNHKYQILHSDQSHKIYCLDALIRRTYIMINLSPL